MPRLAVVTAIMALCLAVGLMSVATASPDRFQRRQVQGTLACDDLIINGSFETGDFEGWEWMGEPNLIEFAQEGYWATALVGSVEQPDQIYQLFYLPEEAESVLLEFWWYMETTETGIGTPSDFLYVEIVDEEGETLITLETQNSASPANEWRQTAIDLAEYPDLRGRSIGVSFQAMNDDDNPTTFLIDHVSLTICVGAPDCPYDWMEPNDTRGTAAALDTGISYYSLYICPSGDEDWFWFPAEAGDDLDIQLYHLPADYDLYLYDEGGELLTFSAAGGVVEERLQWPAAVSGIYYIQVIGYQGAWSTEEYVVRVDVTPAATPTPTPTSTVTCPSDTAGDSFAQATGISSGTVHDGTLCPSGDEDWFRFYVSVGQQMTIQLYDLPANYDLELYSPSNNLLVDAHQDGTIGEQIFHTAANGGDYRIRIYGVLGAYSLLPYHVRVILSDIPTPTPTPSPTPTLTPTPTATTTCPSDASEPNDNFDQAALLTRFTLVYLCPRDDEDWYKVTATAGQDLEVELYNLPADFDLAVLDPYRNPVGTSENDGYRNETVRFTASVSGEYRIRVYSAKHETKQYSAALKVTQLTQPTPLLLSAKKYSQPFDILVEGSDVFWSELAGEQDSPPGGIYMNYLRGNPQLPITVHSTTDFSPADLAYAGGKLYVREWERDWIVQLPAIPAASPKVVMAMAQRLAISRGIEGDTTHIFWGDENSLNRQVIADKAITAMVTIGASFPTVNALTSDGTYIYWTDTQTSVSGTTARVHRLVKTGAGSISTGVSTTSGTFKVIDVVSHSGARDQEVYLAADHGIYSWLGNGSRPPQALYAVEPGARITGMTVDVDYIYWTEIDSFTNALLYMPRRGGSPRVIVTGLRNPRALTDGSSMLFWSETDGIRFVPKPNSMAGAAPQVSINFAPQAPAPGATVVVTAEADDDDGVRELQIYIDGQMVRTCKVDVCSYSLKAPGYASIIKIMAIATDTQGFRSRTPVKQLLVGNSGQDYDRDGLSDQMETILCTDPWDPDSDKDEILDGWEVLGQRFSDGTLLDLPGMGSHPCRADVFVEIDWHRGWPPDQHQIQKTINEFRRHGIALHVDTGQLGGGGEIPLITTSVNKFDDTRDAAQARDPYSDAHRLWTFHYALSSAHCYLNNEGKEECRGGADSGSNITLRKARGAAFGEVFMHELGHSVGLGHGGTLGTRTRLRDGNYVWYSYGWNDVNHKPNYFSMMNYAQSPLIYWDGSNLVRELGYSDVALPDLNENDLDESPGSAFAQALTEYPPHGTSVPLIVVYCTNHTPPYRTLNDGTYVIDRYNYTTKRWEGRPAQNPKGIDWNCNGIIEASVKGDINNDGSYSLLKGWADWSYLPLKSYCPGRSDAYSAAYMRRADSPPCNKPKAMAQGSPTSPDQTDEEHPDPIPLADPVWDLPYEICDDIDNDGDGSIDDGCSDSDGDQIVDDLDNCPFTPNPDQRDEDLNWIGDACETPPAPPSHLTFDNTGGVPRLQWLASPDTEIIGYVVSRRPVGESSDFQHLGGYPSVDASGSSFVDFWLSEPGAYTYQVRSLDRYGVESNPAGVNASITTISIPRMYFPVLLRLQ